MKEGKFLGLIWDTKLTFEPHIKYLNARCQKSLNVLKVLSRTEWGADQTTLLKLYRSLVWSKLDCGCLVYGSASKTALAKLDPPPKVLLLCRSWGACVPRRSQRLCQLEFWLLVGTTMLDRLWARGQTKCNTPLMLATSVFGRIHRRPCYMMAQPKSRLNIPWPNDAECMGHVGYHFSCWYPLLFDVESLAGCVGG